MTLYLKVARWKQGTTGDALTMWEMPRLFRVALLRAAPTEPALQQQQVGVAQVDVLQDWLQDDRGTLSPLESPVALFVVK